MILMGHVDDKLQQLFWIMDVNGDGHISRQELGRFLESTHALAGTEMKES